MTNYLKKASSKKIWLLMLLNFGITSLLFGLYLIGIIKSDIILILSTIICFFLMTFFINEITKRMVEKKFQAKYKPKNYNADVNKIYEILSKNSNLVEGEYGKNYLHINNKTAFKILFIKDNDKYFNNKITENTKGNKKLEECNFFFGLEIFLDPNPELIKKIQQYTFQSEKIFYTGFYLQDDKLVQAHYEQPWIDHEKNFEYILNLLEMKEIESNESNDIQ